MGLKTSRERIIEEVANKFMLFDMSKNITTSVSNVATLSIAGEYFDTRP